MSEERKQCPECQQPLVHSVCEVYDRCRYCGWFGLRKSQLEGYVHPEFLEEQPLMPATWFDCPTRLYLQGLEEAHPKGLGYGKPHEEVRCLMEASPVALTALEGALAYIGNDEGSCDVCGGNLDGGGSVEYSKECPCFMIRKALKMMDIHQQPEPEEKTDGDSNG